MKLFKSKEETKCSCGGKCEKQVIQSTEQTNNDQGIKVLGTGCAKCKQLESATRTAVSELGLNLEVQHISDYEQIANYGVMSMPAIVLDGKVISYGKVLNVSEIKKLLLDYNK